MRTRLNVTLHYVHALSPRVNSEQHVKLEWQFLQNFYSYLAYLALTFILIAPYVSLIRLVWSVNILSNTEIIHKVVQIWPGQTVTCLHTNSPGRIWTTLYVDCIIAYPESTRFFFFDFITHMILQTVNINISYGCNLWTNKQRNFTIKSASMVDKLCEYHFVQCSPIYERALPCEFLWSSVLKRWVWSVGGMIPIGENVPEVSLFQCHFIRQKSQVDWPGIDPGDLR
jgi:hypothetical protein